MATDQTGKWGFHPKANKAHFFIYGGALCRQRLRDEGVFYPPNPVPVARRCGQCLLRDDRGQRAP